MSEQAASSSLKVGINASAYSLLFGPKEGWHGTERAVDGLAKRLPATITNDLESDWWDVAMVCEHTGKIDGSRAKKRVGWTSMSYLVEASGVDLLDKMVFVSEWNKNLVLKSTPELRPEQCVVIPYATEITPSYMKIPGRLLWGSSPDRGLHHALRIFKKARETMPELTLEVTYKMDFLHSKKWLHNVDGLRSVEILDQLNQPGVIVSGELGPSEIQRAISQAEILLYPCDPIIPTEGFGMIVLECMACSTIPLISDADAFPELWGGHVPMLGLPINDDEWIAAIEELRKPKIANRWRRKGRAKARQHSWKAIVNQWREVLHATSG